jgi:hypothetical protein
MSAGDAESRVETKGAPQAALALDRHAKLPIAVILERRPASNPWEEFAWRPVSVVPGTPGATPWTLVFKDGAIEHYFAGVHELELHPRETPRYLHNLSTETPSVYVVVQAQSTEGPLGVVVRFVTVSPADAEAYAEGGDHIIERVPMPPAIAEWLVDYCSLFHVDEKFVKRKRKQHDPEKGFGLGAGSNDYGPSTNE